MLNKIYKMTPRCQNYSPVLKKLGSLSSPLVSTMGRIDCPMMSVQYTLESLDSLVYLATESFFYN
jgi:hypothetical protein